MQKILFIFGFFWLSTTAVFACECPIGSHKDNFRWAKSIFLGQVIGINKKEVPNPKVNGRPLYTVTFKVEKWWKGGGRNEMTIYTDACSSMCCLVKFSERGKYVVYVYEDSFVPSDCAWSAEVKSERAERNIKDLNNRWFRLKARLWPF